MKKIIYFIFMLSIFFPLSAGGEEIKNSEADKIQQEYSKRLISYKQKNLKISSIISGTKIKLIQLEHLPKNITTTETVTGSESPLLDYLNLIKTYFPQAEITGRFSDWRTLSKYRRRAGLHYGYDIYLEKGTKIPAGWPGTVTSVTNWYGEEYGVTVSMNDGLNITYGHVNPQVTVGQEIKKGDIVALCWSDHVDMKMRDMNDNFVDFGRPVNISTVTVKKINYDEKKKYIKNKENLFKGIYHVNLAQSHMDYISSIDIYYTLKLRQLSEKENILLNKKKNKEEINYITMLKEIMAEDFIKNKNKNSEEINFIEEEIKIASQKLKEIHNYNRKGEFKPYIEELEGGILKLKEKLKKIKGTFSSSKGYSKIKSNFPPEHLGIEITIKKQDSKVLSEATRDLKGSLDLYTQGLINYDKVAEFKEKYKKNLIKSRIESNRNIISK